jgi:signal transduction histidine kinase
MQRGCSPGVKTKGVAVLGDRPPTDSPPVGAQPAQPGPRPIDESDGPAPEGRAETDESLRNERRAADGQEHGRPREDHADRVVDLARARADAVLTIARAKEDRDPASDYDGVGLDQERADADDLLEDERAMADELLRREREDSARLLSAFLPLARKSTDRRLFTERANSDAALSSRDDFLGMVSHDLKNLLAGIVLSASVLERRSADRGPSTTPEGKRIARGTDRILMYAARMGRLIGDLVDVTSMTAGKLAVTTAPTDERALISEALEAFRLIAAEKDVTLETTAMDSPLLVMCDHGRILQVLSNLLGNAIKFTPCGGKVSVRAERVDDQVRISVIDSGPGIPEHLHEAVFERFWQAAGDERGGLGLGLYIAKGIIEAHQGKLWVESRVGEGSAFHFSMPCAIAPTA